MEFIRQKTLIQPESNQEYRISGMTWSPNNMRLAVACTDRIIYLLNESI